MTERVVEILIYIMSELRRDRKYSQKLDALSKDLIQRGYTQSEISSALTWIMNRLSIDTEEVSDSERPSQSSHRHLHEIERAVLSTEAYGYVIQLKELGIIDELDVEELLERALMLGTSEVGVDDIKSIVATLLLRDEGLQGYLLLEESTTIH